MSSALRLSIITVLLLATAAFGLIAYNMNLPKQVPVAVTEQGPAPPSTVGYFVAARPLSRGTLARDEDFAVRSAPPERLPAGAILETPDAKAGLTGSLVRKFVEAGSPITLQDVLRPRDRGFLASVLAPDSRAISIKVDEESGVSGLIRRLCKAGEPLALWLASKRKPCRWSLRQTRSRRSQSQSRSERSRWPYGQQSSSGIRRTLAPCPAAMCRRKLLARMQLPAGLQR